eukprot:SAG22_NODE_21_length_31784_cov_15.522897_16_plen_45_part_00
MDCGTNFVRTKLVWFGLGQTKLVWLENTGGLTIQIDSYWKALFK